jgi:hypothetical protein
MTDDGAPMQVSRLFAMEDELVFRRQFAIQFLASYAATHFNDLCANGRQDNLDRLPVEDAEYLSGTAWSHWCFTMPMKPSHRPKESL